MIHVLAFSYAMLDAYIDAGTSKKRYVNHGWGFKDLPLMARIVFFLVIISFFSDFWTDIGYGDFNALKYLLLLLELIVCYWLPFQFTLNYLRRENIKKWIKWRRLKHEWFYILFHVGDNKGVSASFDTLNFKLARHVRKLGINAYAEHIDFVIKCILVMTVIIWNVF